MQHVTLGAAGMLHVCQGLLSSLTWAAQYSSSPAMVSVLGCGWKLTRSCKGATAV